MREHVFNGARPNVSLDTTTHMNLSRIKSFEQLVDYLREFVNWQGDVAPYDFGGVVYLLAALLDNIKAHGVDADFDGIQDHFTPEQIAVLRRIAAQLHS